MGGGAWLSVIFQTATCNPLKGVRPGIICSCCIGGRGHCGVYVGGVLPVSLWFLVGVFVCSCGLSCARIGYVFGPGGYWFRSLGLG